MLGRCPCDSVEMQKRNEKYIHIYKREEMERKKAKKGKRKKKRRIKIKGDGYRREWSNLESQLF